jgi:predicted solute-binding protein
VVIATDPQVQSLDDILKQSDAQVAVVNWFEKFKTSRDAAALRKDLSGHALVFATAAVVKDSHFQRVQQIISERELSPKP